MSNSVIKVQNLSKRYRIGLKEKQSETLMGQIADILKSPWDNLKRLREMDRFGAEDESVFWALKDINFEVKQGEVLGIIGKNGAGKSTLLKILSQISEPTSGRIEIHGRVASLLEVGTGFHPELSGRDNIYMNGTILGMTKKEIDSKLDEIIDFSGVEKFIDTPVKFYSSGMKVRLGFSVAAHLEPEILIIDEVLAVGDYEFQKKCLGKMEDVAGLGRTVLFVSHNMQAVSALTKETIVLSNGKVIFHGKTEKGINEYFKLQNHDQIHILNNSDKDNPFIKSIEVITSEPNGVQLYNSLFEVKIKVENIQFIHDLAVSYSVCDEFGSRIFHELFIMSENNYKVNSNSITLMSSIFNIRLFPGNYFLKVFFADSKKKELIQEFDLICPFKIEVFNEIRDYYWIPGQAKYVEKGEWKIVI